MKREPDEIAQRLVRFLPGVGPVVVRAAQALGFLAHHAANRAPEARVWTAGDPIEQARALAREEDELLLAAAIGLTLSLHEDAFLADEPRVLTLRGTRHSASTWWQTRASAPPPAPSGPPVRADVFRNPEPESPLPPVSGPAAERDE